MKALSVSTLISDPYRAGIALGEALKAVDPEVVFLFSTVHYGHNGELQEGLYDSLENDQLILVGNSGDGFYESQRASDLGVAALGLNSAGKINWQVVHATGAASDPAGATRACLRQIEQVLGGKKPTLMFLAADFHADASQIETVLYHETDVPVIGGFAADNNRMVQCFVYANRQVVPDGIVMLAADGPLKFDISVGNSLVPIGKPGAINSADGTLVHQIDGIGAMDFIERETGKPVLQTDRGVVTLTVIDPQHPARKRLRAIVPDFGSNEGTLGLYGGIEAGKTVQVCLASPDELIREVYAIAEHARTLDFEPQAAIIVSCGGRKQLLGGKIDHEIKALTDAFASHLPLAGFPSFGEIGPLKDSDGYTPNMFHNMTYVLLLIGDGE